MAPDVSMGSVSFSDFSGAQAASFRINEAREKTFEVNLFLFFFK
jgi:hypothetical protein